MAAPTAVRSILAEPLGELRATTSVFFDNSSRSPSNNRSKRSSPGGRRPPAEVHRENPIPSACLGVFGLSQYTTERDIKGSTSPALLADVTDASFVDLFHKFGRIKDVQVVIDKKTNKSRGFGFVYFEEVESATRVCPNQASFSCVT